MRGVLLASIALGLVTSSAAAQDRKGIEFRSSYERLRCLTAAPSQRMAFDKRSGIEANWAPGIVTRHDGCRRRSSLQQFQLTHPVF